MYDEGLDKYYLVLLTLYTKRVNLQHHLVNEFATERDWSIMVGRQRTYDYLKMMLMTEAMDPHTSFIVPVKVDESRKVSFESEPITVYRFLKVMFDNETVLDTNFNIDEYVIDLEDRDPSILSV